jgi:Sulfotransferase domain
VAEGAEVTLAVIGAGFGRTGTLSLKAALEELGLGPCYHMREAIQHLEHAPMWEAAARGEAVDWDRVLGGYRATVDWPGAAFYEQLSQNYPEARVILTVRDPDRWYDSASATIYDVGKAGASPFLRMLALAVPPLNRFRRARHMIDTVVWQGTFNGRFGDRHYAIRTFQDWNRRVGERIPADRLLVYEVTEGWAPLCRFLDAPVPDTPFPHLNDVQSFRRFVRRMRMLSIAVPTLLVAVSVAAIAAIAGKRAASRVAGSRPARTDRRTRPHQLRRRTRHLPKTAEQTH